MILGQVLSWIKLYKDIENFSSWLCNWKLIKENFAIRAYVI